MAATDMKGKVALVTGGAQGLGKTYALMFLRRGAKVLFSDVNREKGEETAQELSAEFGKENVAFAVCDVAVESEFKDLFTTLHSTFGRLDVLVNNAGIIQEVDYEKCIAVNLVAVVRGTMLAFEYMRVDKGGNGGIIVNIASTQGIVLHPCVPVYCGTKHAVRAYTSSLAAHPSLETWGVRFLCLCPGFSDTTIMKPDPSRLVPEFRDMEVAKRNVAADGGVNAVEDVGEALMQLVTDRGDKGVVMTVTKGRGIEYINN